MTGHKVETNGRMPNRGIPHIEPTGSGFRLRYSLDCDLLHVALAREWIAKRKAVLRGSQAACDRIVTVEDMLGELEGHIRRAAIAKLKDMP